MNSERLTQGSAFANDSDYDALHGRVTYERTTRGMTLDGWQVDYTVTYIDLGRSAPIDAPDPDRELADEFCADFAYAPAQAAALATIRENKAERHQRLRADIEATLREHGPASANTIAEQLDSGSVARVLDVLRRNSQAFTYIGGQFKVWGLPGQTYTRPVIKLGSKLKNAIYAALTEHGQQTARELWQHLGGDQTSISKCLLRNPEAFVVAGMREARGTVPPTRVWGLAL